MATKHIFTVLLALVLSISGTAQIEKADAAYAAHHYPEAIRLFEQFLRRHEAPGASLKLAIAYWKTNDVEQAEAWLTQAIEENDDPQAFRWYGQLLMVNGKYEQASEWLFRYSEHTQDPNAVNFSRDLAEYCQQLADNDAPPADCQILETNYSGKHMDFSPTFVGDTLVFVSNRPGAETKEGQRDPWTKQRFTDLFAVVPSADGTEGNAKPYNEAICTHLHEGPAVFDATRQEWFVTTSVPNPGKKQSGHTSRLKIVIYAQTSAGTWSPARDLNFHNTAFNMVHPALDPSGERLFFSANYPDGQGGMDLYYTDRLETGMWSDPVNLGPEINTPGDEAFPVIQGDGELVFSSDFHLGFGGMDMYRTRWTGTAWSNPKNMGSPLNGSRDDFGLVMLPEQKCGYFSSNRGGGNDNIYRANFDDVLRVEGLLTDAETGLPIPLAMVELASPAGYQQVFYSDDDGLYEFKLPMTGTFTVRVTHPDYTAAKPGENQRQIVADDMLVGESRRLDFTLAQRSNETANGVLCGTITDPLGHPIPGAIITIENRITGELFTNKCDSEGNFFQPAKSDLTYVIQASADGFSPQTTSVSCCNIGTECQPVFIQLNSATTVSQLMERPEIIRSGMQVELFHVYFDRNLAAIRSDAAPELQKLLELFEAHPTLKGQIQAHTDTRHTDRYNLELSQQRAQAVCDWLMANGIAEDRLKAKGYGEVYLMNQCDNGVVCSELEHQRNRRVEFRVLDIQLDQEMRSKEKPEFQANTSAER